MYIYTHTHTYIYTHINIHTHTHNGILPSHKKEWNFDFYNMDELGRHYTKWHKSGRERQIPYDIAYMNKLENKRNKNQTHWI